MFAKLAAPGMCNSADDEPCLSGTPSQAAIQGDTRTAAQRNHDALLAAARALLASGDLGQHNGLPASIIVTTTLQELEAGAGRGLTGGGTLLPMSDVIRLGSHAHHYLAIFDKGKALALYHTKRLASPAQRIVLYARDRGCTFPGCTLPAYLCEAHHCDPYATNPVTDINTLALTCHPNHAQTEQGWTTRKNHRYDTEWIPPPTPRPRPTPHQHLPPPRKTPTRLTKTTSRTEMTARSINRPSTAGSSATRGLLEAEVRYSCADDQRGQMHVEAARTVLLVHCCHQRIEADCGKPVAQLPAVRG